MRHVVLIAVLLATAAQAQTIYKWTDPKGVMHYTDDPSTIPPNAKVTTTEGEELSNTGTPEKVRPQPVPLGSPVPVGAAQPVPLPAEPTSPEEQYWRGEFRAVRDRIRSLEDELTADQLRYDGRLPMSGQYYCPPYAFPRFSGSGSFQQQGSSVSGSINVPLGGGAKVNVNGQANVAQGFKNFSSVVPFTGYGGCWYAPDGEYARAAERMQLTRTSLARAKDDLADLERRAAFNAVPLEWRR